MTPHYVPLENIQLLYETSFSKIQDKKIIWGGTLKWDTLYIIINVSLLAEGNKFAIVLLLIVLLL